MMDQYLRAHERAEKIIADDTQSNDVRVNAIDEQLQRPIPNNTRIDYLLIRACLLSEPIPLTLVRGACL